MDFQKLKSDKTKTTHQIKRCGPYLGNGSSRFPGIDTRSGTIHQSCEDTGSMKIRKKVESRRFDFSKSKSGYLDDKSTTQNHYFLGIMRGINHIKRGRRTKQIHQINIHHFFSISRCFLGLNFLLKRMSQSNLMKQTASGKKIAVSSKKMKITVPHFDNLELIQGYSKTLIGRCMNPAVQDMKALLYMLPHIWKAEERVAGADLGLGRFQFDFEREEDITEVMKMEPFHFDYWMLSIERWAPVVDPKYPSSIMFWVRIIGIPLHFWAEPTFQSIRKALGYVKAVNLDEGKIQVVIDAVQPLCFETEVEFHGREETTVFLRYEKLFGYCRICFSLCHNQKICPTRTDSMEWKAHDEDHDESRQNTGNFQEVILEHEG
ncbi:uncharacterized protein LOC112089946 [Eutrema salsugineum]|uniref:uncharacterized protein LOC112089946 n=1 Tax=Eutrema salsugineum TaxID=72664 RepID=UPI000CED240B|nr:uncharacterized protein LOC112089946 [Eutrema salsugineum]